MLVSPVRHIPTPVTSLGVKRTLLRASPSARGCADLEQATFSSDALLQLTVGALGVFVAAGDPLFISSQPAKLVKRVVVTGNLSVGSNQPQASGVTGLDIAMYSIEISVRLLEKGCWQLRHRKIRPPHAAFW